MRPVIDQNITRNLVWEPQTYVKAIRLRHGLSARMFAEKLGAGPALLYRIENNEGFNVSTLRTILNWHNTNTLPRPCSVETCWLGKDHDGPHEDHS